MTKSEVYRNVLSMRAALQAAVLESDIESRNVRLLEEAIDAYAEKHIVTPKRAGWWLCQERDEKFVVQIIDYGSETRTQESKWHMVFRSGYVSISDFEGEFIKELDLNEL